MGETVIDPAEWRRDPSAPTTPVTTGLVFSAAALLSFVVCVIAFAVRQNGLGVDAACATLLASGLALSWVTGRSRRVREDQRLANGAGVAR